MSAATPGAPAWAEFERISELPAVDEAIRALIDDNTGDNATCVVRAVLEAVRLPVAGGPDPALWLAWNTSYTGIRFWTADAAVAKAQAATGLTLTPFYSAEQMRDALGLRADAVPEGRTPADAQVLRRANHALKLARAALEAILRAPSVGSNGPGSSTLVVQDFNLRATRAAIAAIDALAQPAASDTPEDAHPLYQRGWKAGYKHGAWQSQHCAAQPAASGEPVTLADVLDALNLFNRPKPSEDDGPWEGGHFIRVDHLPDFINIIAAAWFAQPAPAPANERPTRADFVRVARCFALAYGLHADAPDYLPRTDEARDAFEPHAWVIALAMQAHHDGKADGLSQPAPALVPSAPFLFIAMDDNGRAGVTWCADEAAVRAAVQAAMFWLPDGEELSAEHADELAASVDELLESGGLNFEGDPPLLLYRVAGTVQPARPGPDAAAP